MRISLRRAGPADVDFLHALAGHPAVDPFLAAVRDPDDSAGEIGAQRVLAHVKSNNGEYNRSRKFRIEERALPGQDDLRVARLIEDGESSYTARELLASSGDSGEVIEEAKRFLRTTLKDGRCASAEVIAEASELGISESTLKRAKSALGIKSVKEGDRWFWQLPDFGTEAAG